MPPVTEITWNIDTENNNNTLLTTPAAAGPGVWETGGSGPISFTLDAVSVQVGPNLADAYGFRDGTGGSISPTTFNGNTILRVEAGLNRGGFDFTQIIIAADLLQTEFTSITIGAVTLLSADAVFDNSTPGQSVWSWIAGVGNILGGGTALFNGAATYTADWS